MGRRLVTVIAEVEKTCAGCGLTKPVEAFYTKRDQSVRAHPRYTNRCKRCHCAYTAELKRKRYAGDREAKARDQARKLAWVKAGGRHRLKHLTLSKNALSYHAYDLQFAEQNGRCAICLRVPFPNESRFPFDHDHGTGLARGVLCAECNNGLGCFKDNVEHLKAAISYLRRWASFHQSVADKVLDVHEVVSGGCKQLI